jgi:hypothetical protein
MHWDYYMCVLSTCVLLFTAYVCIWIVYTSFYIVPFMYCDIWPVSITIQECP